MKRYHIALPPSIAGLVSVVLAWGMAGPARAQVASQQNSVQQQQLLQDLQDLQEHASHIDFFPIPPAVGDQRVALDWWNVLLLVNANSPAGLEVVRLYREYHPQIIDEQIVYLDGLVDCASATATPADEIITRADFEAHIAEPTRAHLRAYGLVDRVYVIITTAGMPYRIEDTDAALANVILPAATDAILTSTNRAVVNAASVESELSVLFLIDPAAPSPSRMPINGRVVNPYQGYRSSIKWWSLERALLTRRETFRWTYMWLINSSPKMEGLRNAAGLAAMQRRMSPADLYLTARLDGPRVQGGYPIFAVREMLERAARVSDPAHPRFVGYDRDAGIVAIDHSPRPPAPDVFAATDIFNVPVGIDMLAYEDHPIPPGGEEITVRKQVNHYFEAFRFLTTFPATVGGTGSRLIVNDLGGRALWDDSGTMLNDAFLAPDAGIVGLMTYGRNGGDGRPPNYLLVSGPGGGPLFKCVPGAVFISIESYNAVTLFSNPATGHGKIVDFIQIGGTAGAGHSFEPEVSGAFHGEFLYANLLRDDDGNGVGDLTLAEAVFTGMPYVSWSEVLIGDPLMRLRSGPGEVVLPTPPTGDTNDDGTVGYLDVLAVLDAYGTDLGDATYNLLADVNEDGSVGAPDLTEVVAQYGE